MEGVSKKKKINGGNSLSKKKKKINGGNILTIYDAIKKAKFSLLQNDET